MRDLSSVSAPSELGMLVGGEDTSKLYMIVAQFILKFWISKLKTLLVAHSIVANSTYDTEAKLSNQRIISLFRR